MPSGPNQLDRAAAAGSLLVRRRRELPRYRTAPPSQAMDSEGWGSFRDHFWSADANGIYLLFRLCYAMLCYVMSCHVMSCYVTAC